MPLVIVGLGIGFFAFVAAFTLLGLSQTHTAQHGDSQAGGFWAAFYHDNILAQILGVAQKAARAIVSRFAGSQVKHLTQFFAALAYLTGATYKANANTADAAAGAAERIQHELKAAEKKLHREVVRAEAKLNHEIHAAERRLGAEVKADERRLHHQATQLRHATHAIDVTIPRDIGHIRTRNETLTRDQVKLKERTKALEDGAIDTWDWIKAHPFAGVTGVFAGAVSIALTRLGFGFMRCRSWQRLGRSLTCNDANILGDLLAAATLVVGAMSLVELAREEQKVIGEGAKIVRGFWEL